MRRWCTRRRPGQAFSCWVPRLGGSRRSVATGRDRHPRARARPGAVPFWKGEASAARRSWVRRSGRSRAGRWGSERRCWSASTTSTRVRRATYRVSARAAGGHARAAERARRSWSSAFATRSAIGGCACVSRIGGRVHAAWALAISARVRERFEPRGGRDLLRRRDRAAPARRADELDGALPPRPKLVLVEPDEVQRAVIVGELGGSALFGARFRENAGRALLSQGLIPANARRCGSSG